MFDRSDGGVERCTSAEQLLDKSMRRPACGWMVLQPTFMPAQSRRATRSLGPDDQATAKARAGRRDISGEAATMPEISTRNAFLPDAFTAYMTWSAAFSAETQS